MRKNKLYIEKSERERERERERDRSGVLSIAKTTFVQIRIFQ